MKNRRASTTDRNPRGAGRKPLPVGSKRANKSLCMAPACWKVIEDLAAEYGTSRGRIVQQAIEACFKSRIQ